MRKVEAIAAYIMDIDRWEKRNCDDALLSISTYCVEHKRSLVSPVNSTFNIFHTYSPFAFIWMNELSSFCYYSRMLRMVFLTHKSANRLPYLSCNCLPNFTLSRPNRIGVFVCGRRFSVCHIYYYITCFDSTHLCYVHTFRSCSGACSIVISIPRGMCFHVKFFLLTCSYTLMRSYIDKAWDQFFSIEIWI